MCGDEATSLSLQILECINLQFIDTKKHQKVNKVLHKNEIGVMNDIENPSRIEKGFIIFYLISSVTELRSLFFT